MTFGDLKWKKCKKIYLELKNSSTQKWPEKQPKTKNYKHSKCHVRKPQLKMFRKQDTVEWKNTSTKK